MKARLLADADLRLAIVRGLRNREPTVDFSQARGLIPDSMADSDVLALAANLQRVLVSHDFETMPGHFYRFIEATNSPGIILIPQIRPIGLAIDDLRIAWTCQEAEEFNNRILYLPL